MTKQAAHKTEPAATGRGGGYAAPSPAAHPVVHARGADHAPRLLLQPKLTVRRPDDVYEKEADRIADEVMRMPDPAAASRGIDSGPIRSPSIQRLCSQCEEEEKLQRREQAPGAGAEGFDFDAVDATLRRPGRPLDAATRAFFEPRFGVDFSAVRVHTDAQAAASARGVSALAYTVGSDVVFDAGQYAPHSDSGRCLLAHELTHVVQQSHGARQVSAPTISRQEAPNPIWGGFRIEGDEAYIRSIRADLNRINATANGRRLLHAISENRSGTFTPLIRIRPSTACGFLPSGILFNAAGCNVPNVCPAPGGDWSAVPNYVYLYHEIVHAYLYHMTDHGTHPARECMVTGLGRYAVDLPYNENRFRCELGLPVRPCYGDECPGFPAPTCDALAEVERREEETRERERRAASARSYEDQAACVRRLGGCPESRSGGMPSDAEIVRYNDECRRETGYSGAAITPTCP